MEGIDGEDSNREVEGLEEVTVGYQAAVIYKGKKQQSSGKEGKNVVRLAASHASITGFKVVMGSG